jgi:hypothetical protein
MLRQLIEKERPLRDVPLPVMLSLLLLFAVQLIWHSQQAPVVARAEDLPWPKSARTYVMSSFGEPIATAKVLNLWLQAFDNQPGVSIPLQALDYKVVEKWLDTILELDPRGHYPMLVATRIYGSISNHSKQREMMEYIFFKFNENPNKNWRWLAEAVITAKHELKDMKLALKYANALTTQATGANVPYWARDMKIIVPEDMGEVEAAKILVGGLIDSGEITDPYELRFLQQKIQVLEQKVSNIQQDVDK